MNYGQWNEIELQRAKNKVQKYSHLYESCWELVRQINNKLYEQYCTEHTTRSNIFSIFTPLLEREKFLNKVTSWSLNEPNGNPTFAILKEQNSLYKYNLELSDAEYGFMEFFKYEIAFTYDFSKKVQQFGKLLSYCSGGDIDTDEIYLLCDLDINIAHIESELNNYKVRVSE